MENHEKQLLEKDRDLRMEYLNIEKPIENEWDEDRFEAEKDNTIKEYQVSEEFSNKNISDEDEKEVWLLEIFNMMTYINDGDSCEIVAHKIFNEFLQIGCEVELDELLNMVNHLGLSCQQELLSIKIAENAFELGASPEIVLARVREILS